jgi:hypothetical protein
MPPSGSVVDPDASVSCRTPLPSGRMAKSWPPNGLAWKGSQVDSKTIAFVTVSCAARGRLRRTRAEMLAHPGDDVVRAGPRGEDLGDARGAQRRTVVVRDDAAAEDGNVAARAGAARRSRRVLTGPRFERDVRAGRPAAREDELPDVRCRLLVHTHRVARHGDVQRRLDGDEVSADSATVKVVAPALRAKSSSSAAHPPQGMTPSSFSAPIRSQS